MTDTVANGEFRQAVAERGEVSARERLEGFRTATLAWLALVPEWTDTMARQTDLGFGERTQDLIARLSAAGLIEQRETLGAGGTLGQAVWLRADVRRQIGREFAVRPGTAGRHLVSLIAKLSTMHGDALGESLRVWLNVAGAALNPTLDDAVLREVDNCLRVGELAQASRILTAAQALGDTLGGKIGRVAQRAQRRIEWHTRRTADEQFLRHYVHRTGIEQAIARLIGRQTETQTETEAYWGLHILGPAGSGKTMVIRYLATGRLAEDLRIDAVPVARVDFDHLDPRYPERCPGELFLALASDLRGASESAATETSYQALELGVAALHAALSASDRDSRVARLQHDVVESFAAYLRTISERVVLVLDTCEELAKFYVPDEPAPIIDKTFELLEAVHELFPGVRVVFAGRRRLTASPPGESETTGPRLKRRPHIRVVPLAAYSRDEAQEYLRRRLDGVPRDASVLEAILERSVIRTRRGTRYNPYDLAGYCEWVATDETVDVEQLQSATGDSYVEYRLIGRISEPNVRRALPIAAELGRFDRSLITPALERSGIEPGLTFRQLAVQEWISTVSRDANGQPASLEIDEHVVERLRAVLRRWNRGHAREMERLGLDAERVVETTVLDRLAPSTVEAAVRLLPLDLGAAFWQRLETRICEEEAWSWADRVAGRVAAVEAERRAAAADEHTPTVLGAVLATQAMARLHSNGAGPQLRHLWAAVATVAERHPDPAQAARLSARAYLGQLTAAGTVPAELPPPASPVSAAGPDSILAVAQSLLCRGVLPPPPIRYALIKVSRHDDAVLRVVATTLLSAAAILTEGFDPDPDILWDAMATAEQIGDTRRTSWPDWIPPRRPRLIVRLAIVVTHTARSTPLDDATAETFRSWLTEAVENIDDAAEEALAAAVLRVLRTRRPDPPPDVKIDKAVPTSGERMFYAPVYPAVVEYAEALSAAGRPVHASRLLRRVVGSSRATGSHVTEPYETALLRLCRRYRTLLFEPSVNYIARDTDAPWELRGEAWQLLALVSGQVPKSLNAAGTAHAWWVSQTAESISRRSDHGGSILGQVAPDELTVADLADRREWELLTRNSSTVLGPLLVTEPLRKATTPILRADNEDAVRLVFLETPDTVRERLAPAPDAAFGFAALRAGEVLALRLPGQGSELLRLAERSLRAAGHLLTADQAGVLAELAALSAGRPSRGLEAASRLREHLARLEAEPGNVATAWKCWHEYIQILGTRTAPAEREPNVVTARVPGAAVPGTAPEARPSKRAVSGSPRLKALTWWRAQLPDGYSGWLLTFAVPAGALLFLGAVYTNSSTSTALTSAFAAAGTVVAIVAATETSRLVTGERRARKDTGPGSTRVSIKRSPDGSEFVASILYGANRDATRQLVIRRVGGRESGELVAAVELTAEKSFRGLERRRGKQGSDDEAVIVEVEPGLDHFPWERLLSGSVSNATRRPWVRRTFVAEAAPEVPTGNGAAALPGYRGTSLSAPAESLLRRAAFDDRRPRVHHLVGVPVETSVDWQLLVSEGRSTEFTELIDVSALAAQSSLVVLQAEPVGHGAKPFAQQRRGFAEIALSAIAAGSQAVLVIPPLLDGVARIIADRIWNWVSYAPWDDTSAMLLAAEIKALIPRRWEDSDPLLPQDVWLFVRVTLEN